MARSGHRGYRAVGGGVSTRAEDDDAARRTGFKVRKNFVVVDRMSILKYEHDSDIGGGHRGEAYYEERYRQRVVHHLSKKALAMGFTLAPIQGIPAAFLAPAQYAKQWATKAVTIPENAKRSATEGGGKSQ